MTLFHKTKKQRERLGFTEQPGISELDAADFIKFISLFQKSIANIIESYEDKDIALLPKSMAMMVIELHHMAAEIGLPFGEILYEVHKELVSERAASINGVRIDEVYYPRNNSEGIISTLIANRRANYQTTFRELNLPKLLDFYDAGNVEHRNLSSSVNALMGEELGANLLKKYF
jgi:hypothetical protein